ncbi:MAG: PIN domain-containing protein [Candidatus Micrarchaeaceae archaeon]
MRVTVDANILFACIIKDSATRKLFFNPALSLFAPEFIVDEFVLHIKEIEEKSGLEEDELYRLVDNVLGQLTLVSDKDLRPFLPAAASLVDDSKDWLYISCALRENTAIWSHDSDFGMQKRVKVITTKDLLSVVGSL